MAERISQSQLWKIQQDYYHSLGPAAWDDKTPYFITNSQVMAEAYADLLIAFCLDHPLAPDEPFYILELGSGTGRLGYLLLRELRRKLGYFPQLSDVRPIMVLSDIVAANLDSWEQHPRLREMGDSLDFALMTPGNEQQVMLRRSGRALQTGSNPLVVVANYVFDSMPHDEFFLEQGKVEECLVEIHPKAEPERTHSDPDRLDIRDVELALSYRPIEVGGYYSNPRCQAALNFYRSSLTRGSVTIPVAAIECLDRLRTLGKLVLLSSDRGFTRFESMAVYPNHPLALHEGCFSHMVNYHALSFGFKTRLATSRHLLDGLQTVCYSEFPLGPHLTYAFRERLERANAINHAPEIFGLVRDQPNLRALLAFVSLNLGDPNALSAAAKKLAERVGKLDYGAHHEVVHTLEWAWDNDYFFKGSPNLTFWLGHLYATLGYFERALAFFELTVQRQGEDAMLLYLQGSCHQALNQVEPARNLYTRALEKAPDMPEARQALDSLG